MDPLDIAPSVSDYTPLDAHLEQTPGTFFGGKAVLHLTVPNVMLKVPSEHFGTQADLRRLAGGSSSSDNGVVQFSGVDVWITSKNLILYSLSESFGLQISYPTITVTAQDGPDVLLELNLSDPDTADEDIVFLQLRIKPSTSSGSGEQASAGATNGTTPHNDSATAMFKAISDCQELNPDPPAMGDDGAGEDMDDTAPGATGWITSENMADFMDADGNFRMPAGMTVLGGEEEQEGGEEALGEGAGRTRTAAEALEEEDDENKRSRTD